MTKMGLFWAAIGCGVAGLAFWIVTTTETIPPKPFPLLILFLVFGFGPVGGFWMMYMAIRYEARPFRYLLLAFVPYYFIGYYFERIRGRNLSYHSRKLGG